jgi:hypothetical protein
VADLSELKLSSRYDGVELTTLNRYVVVEGYGTSVQVAITVTENGDDSNGNGSGDIVEGGGCTGCGSIDTGSGWTTIGLLAVLAIAFFAVRLVKKSKSDDKGV